MELNARRRPLRDLAVEEPGPEVTPLDEPLLDPDRPEIDSWGDAVELVQDTLTEMAAAFFANLPLYLAALVIIVLGVVVARAAGRWSERGLRRTPADAVVVSLSQRLVRFLLVIVFAIFALSVAGVRVGAALATLGLAGLALAFALQNILENFVAGLLLLVRKPFRAGDQIRTGDWEGTVQEIDLRVTRLVSYDGELVLVPNADVFRSPIINLTDRGRRRSELAIGIDYRDDHVRGREVLLDAVRAVDGVLAQPEPRVLLHELGDSGVEFRLLYWTLPDIATVRGSRDRVLAAAKSAVEAAGMTIPWPIRTVSFDNRLRLDASDDHGSGAPT